MTESSESINAIVKRYITQEYPEYQLQMELYLRSSTDDGSKSSTELDRRFADVLFGITIPLIVEIFKHAINVYKRKRTPDERPIGSPKEIVVEEITEMISKELAMTSGGEEIGWNLKLEMETKKIVKFVVENN